MSPTLSGSIRHLAGIARHLSLTHSLIITPQAAARANTHNYQKACMWTAFTWWHYDETCSGRVRRLQAAVTASRPIVNTWVIHRVIDLHAFVGRANGSGFNCTDDVWIWYRVWLFFYIIFFFLSNCIQQLRRVNVFCLSPPHWHVRAAAHSSFQDVVLNLSIRAGGCVQFFFSSR